MKKFLLVLSCFVFAVCAKAAEYEIATALSSPYGMFSTFSVFGNAAVYDLIIGANSVDGVDNVYKPIQETYVDAGAVSFGGNLSVKRDLEFNAPNQTYGSVLVSRYSSGTLQRNTFFDMNFTAIEIPSLLASTLVTGPLKLTPAARITDLYTAEFYVKNGSNLFKFPSVRGTTFGKIIYSDTPSSKCGGDNKGHYYGPWVTCTGGSCPSDTCEGGDEIGSFTCPDDAAKSKNCVDKRQVTYNTANVITKPYISAVKPYYRKCVYENNVQDTGAIQCVMEEYASEEEAFRNNNIGGMELCSTTDMESCISLCSKYDGGCEASARECVFIDETAFGSDCEASGWEMGSGLECKDSYTRALYTVYTCPMGSDYTNRPEHATFSQTRDVACAGQNVDVDNTSDAYCGTRFLTVGF